MREYENKAARAENHPVVLAERKCEDLGVGHWWQEEWKTWPVEVRRATLAALSEEQSRALLALGEALDNAE